ncbi:MAG: sugar kinase [Candidatus Lokiarchaeota archaeon]|nr:sugar kinase [Candidatus Lokiarchaeota archaeon]
MKNVVTLGEIMLRLKSPGHQRLFQSNILEATFGGSEANVAVSISNYGLPTIFITALPKNTLGDAVIQELRSFGVGVAYIARNDKRLGVYYLETGSGPRPSNVIYDRADSSINHANAEDFNWNNIFNNAQWLHISGITPALSQNSANLTESAMKIAEKKGITISCDLNYRSKLWKYGKSAPEIMRPLMKYVKVIIANEEDIQNSLDFQLDQKIGGTKLDENKYDNLARRVVEHYSNVEIVAISLRESFSADFNRWGAMYYRKKEDKSYFSRKYELKNIVDRVGGGDSFAAGLIYALCTNMDAQAALEFAVGASALKHTIPGDVNRVSKDEVLRLIKGDRSGRVKR